MNADSTSATDFEAAGFLAAMAKTLSRINLYSLNHPLVAESIQTSLTQLSNYFYRQNEMTVAWSGEKLLLNGAPLSVLGSLQEILGGLFEKYQLHSITFQKGVSGEELIAFYKLLTMKQELIQGLGGAKTFLEKEKVAHIQLDIAFFTKVAGKQPVPGEGKIGTVPKAAPGKMERETAAELMHRMEDAPLESMLWEIIQKAVQDPEDQKKIYAIIFKQIQAELDDHVQTATRQLRQEKQQITNEQGRTESVINKIAEGVVVVDDAGKIVTMNLAAERMYGRPLSELKGRKVSETSKEEWMIALANEIANPPDKELSKDITVQSTEDTEKTLRNSVAMIQNPDGKIVGMISVLNDITKQKELQRMQTDFLSHVTHELRSPLTAIKAALGTISQNLNAEDQQILTIANRNINRLARLINDLLDFGKMEAGKIPLAFKPTDPGPLLKNAVQSLESWARTKHISISVALPEELPNVIADEDRITQVLINLISNALKFTPANGRISVNAQALGTSYLRISVSDTGPGIPEKERQRIFEKFFQLHQNRSSETPGTGLGLYIAKTIVELHKGQLGLESEVGKGSTFYFTLPASPKPQPKSTGKGHEKVEKKKSWLAKLFGK